MSSIVDLEVVPYNPDWPQYFQDQAQAIKSALGDNFLTIHHVGSTSVPGLAAKPKIDIIAVVHEGSKSISALQDIGYQYKGEYNIPFHFGFSLRGNVDVNLHLYEEGHPEIELNLVFRDYLRAHPQALKDYAALKIGLLKDKTSLVKENSAFSNYTLRKGDFIREILNKAGFKSLRVLKCSDATEWNAAKHFQEKDKQDSGDSQNPSIGSTPDHDHLILYRGTEIIGYAHIRAGIDHRAVLQQFSVESLAEKEGAAQYFLAVCEKWLKARGYKSIHLSQPVIMVNFFKHHNYIEMPLNDSNALNISQTAIALGKTL